MNKEHDALEEMVKTIALIEYQNSSIIQKYREIEHRIKAIRFRYLKQWGPMQVSEKDFLHRINQEKRSLRHDSQVP